MASEERVWGRELAVEALNLQLLRLNKRLLLLNLRLLRMNLELLRQNAEKGPRMNRLLRRLRALRLDVARRLRKVASTPSGAGTVDEGLLLLMTEVADLMRFLEEIQRAELLMRRTGG